ncbi:MAG TPA: hypothetical protein DCP28_35120 [Cytophagales bacterium]|nr:hypothetical protein [Cytophagales bacterium]
MARKQDSGIHDMREKKENTTGIVARIEAGEFEVDHGDYQRIARLCLKSDGKPYTADYVRKVLLGLRKNAVIEKKALAYFRKKQSMYKALQKIS